MRAAPLGDELRQSGGGDRVGDDGLAGLFVEQNRRDQRDQAVAVDRAAVFIHDGGAVAVRVEDHAQIGAGFLDGLGDGGHGVLVLGVGNVVGEMAVRIEELAALGLRAQRFEEARVEAARAVARVHHDVQAEQRTKRVVLKALAHHLGQTLGVDGQKVAGLHQPLGQRHVDGGIQDLSDVLALETALAGDQLEAVLVPGMMTGGNHDRAVAVGFRLDGGDEHGGRGTQSAVQHVAVGGSQALDQSLLQLGAGQAGIMSHGDGQLVGGGIVLFRQPQRKGVADAFGGFDGQHGRNAVMRKGVSADIRSAFEFHPFGSHNYPQYGRWL